LPQYNSNVLYDPNIQQRGTKKRMIETVATVWLKGTRARKIVERDSVKKFFVDCRFKIFRRTKNNSEHFDEDGRQRRIFEHQKILKGQSTELEKHK
jgi:hypothetical protein